MECLKIVKIEGSKGIDQISLKKKAIMQGKEKYLRRAGFALNSFKRIFYEVKTSWCCSIGQMLPFSGSVSCEE
jgi:hypothetical protein